MKRQLERKRRQLEAERERVRIGDERIVRLAEEIHSLEDAIILLMSRMGRSADEALSLLEASLPPMPQDDLQAQDAPESEVIHEETE